MSGYPFQSLGEDLEAWEALDETVKAEYAEAIALVKGGRNTARLRELFTDKDGLDVNRPLVPMYGETLLYQAVFRENLEIVKALLALGANPATANAIGGETPTELLISLEEDEGPLNSVQKEIYTLLKEEHSTDNTVKQMMCGACCCSAADNKGKLMLCSRCRDIRYCSRECQINHWKTHKASCQPEKKRDAGDQFTKSNAEVNVGSQAAAADDDDDDNLYWAIGQDPEAIRVMREPFKQDSEDEGILQELKPKIAWAKEQSPQRIAMLAKRNKYISSVTLQQEELGELQSRLIDEAFSLLEITDDEELNCASGASGIVARIKEIYSSVPAIDLNVPSKKGTTLLLATITNYCLEDKDPEAQLDLVRFFLEMGADPNLEDCGGTTALDELDYKLELDDLTPQQSEMIRLLKEAGGLIMPVSADGTRNGNGKRGDTVGRHEEERQRRREELAGMTVPPL